MYEPYRVLPEGWQQSFGSEDASNAAQSGEGAGSKETKTRKEGMRTKAPDGFRISVLCPCGVTFSVMPHLVRAGKKKTCSRTCFYKFRIQPKERARKWKTASHLNGKTNHLYGAWSGMMTRCYNQKHSSYANYGGRGVTVCREWHDWDVFHDWAIQNRYARGLQIDRIKNSLGYCPENCRWVTHKQNQQNRTNVRAIIALSKDGRKTIFGSALDAGKVLGVPGQTISRNLRNNTSCRALLKAGFVMSYA